MGPKAKIHDMVGELNLPTSLPRLVHWARVTPLVVGYLIMEKYKLRTLLLLLLLQLLLLLLLLTLLLTLLLLLLLLLWLSGLQSMSGPLTFEQRTNFKKGTKT